MTAGQIVALVEVSSPELHQEGEHAVPDQALAVVALVALSGGPMDGWWFKVGDLVEHQAAAVAMGHTAADRAGAILGYRSASRSQRHRTRPELVAALWVWTGAPGVCHLLQLEDPRSLTGVSCATSSESADSVRGQEFDHEKGPTHVGGVDHPRGSAGSRPTAYDGGCVGASGSAAGVRNAGEAADDGRTSAGRTGGAVLASAPGRGVFVAPGGADEGEPGRSGRGRRCADRAGSGFSEVGSGGEGCVDGGQKETTPEPDQRLGVDQVTGRSANSESEFSVQKCGQLARNREVST